MTFGSVVSWLSTYLTHPLTGLGYQFWSGVGSDFGEITLIAAVIVYVRRHNCHHLGCWRLQFHVDPKHGHPVCRRHFSGDVPGQA